ncbi:MinD/ParA family ATP-binding protein [Actinopolymorpha alba]|uniref:MinD/ParA family ATP-binding protein n=1 Tax=Actinopolymorpha alba TaxID=533267 RepID=UPI00039CFD87|nr:MinD/ParA family protein [Actinopolymorpha alba]
MNDQQPHNTETSTTGASGGDGREEPFGMSDAGSENDDRSYDVHIGVGRPYPRLQGHGSEPRMTQPTPSPDPSAPAPADVRADEAAPESDPAPSESGAADADADAHQAETGHETAAGQESVGEVESNTQRTIRDFAELSGWSTGPVSGPASDPAAGRSSSAPPGVGSSSTTPGSRETAPGNAGSSPATPPAPPSYWTPRPTETPASPQARRRGTEGSSAYDRAGSSGQPTTPAHGGTSQQSGTPAQMPAGVEGQRTSGDHGRSQQRQAQPGYANPADQPTEAAYGQHPHGRQTQSQAQGQSQGQAPAAPIPSAQSYSQTPTPQAPAPYPQSQAAHGAQQGQSSRPVQGSSSRPPVPQRLAMGAGLDDEDDEFIEDLATQQRRPVPRHGWQGALYRISRINLGPGRRDREEIELRQRLNRQLRRTRGYCGYIGIASEKGGVGKTTLAALLAAELAEGRRESVGVADLNPDLGTLPDRLGVRPHHSIRDLLAHVEEIPWRYHVHDFMEKVPEMNVRVLAASTDRKIRHQLSVSDVELLAELFAPFFSFAILDNGTHITHEAMLGTLRIAHGMVLVTDNTKDGANLARKTLQFLTDNGFPETRRRIVLAVVAKETASPVKVRAIERAFQDHVRALVVVPYDPALDGGGKIPFRDPNAIHKLLRPQTREAVRGLAAILIDDLVS